MDHYRRSALPPGERWYGPTYLPGAGAPPEWPPGAGPLVFAYVKDAYADHPALLDALAVSDPVLFGHSDGASIALIHAASGIRPVRGAILLAPHVMVEEVCVRSIAAARDSYAGSELGARLAPYHADPEGAFRGWCDIWLDPRFRDWNIEAFLPRIRCPVLALQGKDDEYATMRQIEVIAEQVPGTQLLKLPDCGHSPHRDQEAAVLSALAAFVAGLG